ncbi:hypothetical protein G7048_27645 (plasmid) [Diaphorobacter sp. HDW4B]|uniref:dynamin family protein n=1 Tax=Diaphorobacter sp. HDW4B TaxID=2714925 RepID=UPI00140BF56F|nr:dynamin family protein [Diaphorobacter sp. HDW4B]QIL74245.1 hypothetical protein G7048_27645 [Diaphorobacter sp. HDW4B]
MSTSERAFMNAIAALGFADRDLQPVLGELTAWQAGLAEALRASPLTMPGLKSDSEIHQQGERINADLQAQVQSWEGAWANLQPAQSLAQRFENKVIFLVFGKFNAGKSSLCNLLAERFLAHGEDVQYFHLTNGQLQESQEPFREGATETTARLQGVCLGNKLVLLDTPGLHSVTADNAALTQRFLDSADAVLWLTSSTSPGQVQELDDLAQELRRNKPLLPIITRSDFLEEDEIDGEIQSVLRNKTPDNRALQEADVQARTSERLQSLGLNPALQKPPLSVSAHVAREAVLHAQSLADSGIERLYTALLQIAQPALDYKQRKPAETQLHFLEEVVLGGLSAHTVPALQALRGRLQQAQSDLPHQQMRIVKAVWRQVVPELAVWLEEFAPAQDVDGALAKVSHSLQQCLDQQCRAVLADFDLPQSTPVRVILEQGIGFESAIDGPDAVTTDAPALAVIGYERLHSALEDAIHSSLSVAVTLAAEHCEAVLSGVDAEANQFLTMLQSAGHDLHVLTRKLRY